MMYFCTVEGNDSIVLPPSKIGANIVSHTQFGLGEPSRVSL